MIVLVTFVGRGCCLEPFQLHITVIAHQKQLLSCVLGQTGSRTQSLFRLIVSLEGTSLSHYTACFDSVSSVAFAWRTLRSDPPPGEIETGSDSVGDSRAGV